MPLSQSHYRPHTRGDDTSALSTCVLTAAQALPRLPNNVRMERIKAVTERGRGLVVAGGKRYNRGARNKSELNRLTA